MSNPASTQHTLPTHLKLLSQLSCRSKDHGRPLKSNQIYQIFRDLPQWPSSPDIQSLKGMYLAFIDQLEQALIIYRKVLSVFPLHAPTLRRMGQLLIKIYEQESLQGKQKSEQSHKFTEGLEMLNLAALLQPQNLYTQQLIQEETKNQSQRKQEDHQEPQVNNQTEHSILKEVSLNQRLDNRLIQQYDDEDENLDNTPIWKINVLPQKIIKKEKSVIFKSQIDLGRRNDYLRPIQKKASILKVRSMQFQPLILKYDESKITECSFDIKKLNQKSIDGKLLRGENQNNNQEGRQSRKQVMFQIDNSIHLHKPDDLANITKRKSSMSSKPKIGFK